MTVKNIKFTLEQVEMVGELSEAFKVTLSGLTVAETQKVADFVRDVLMKNRNQIAYKYGRVYE